MNPLPATPLGVAEILRIAGSVSPKTAYPTVDEVTRTYAQIEQDHPGLVRSVRIGRSRLGEPIRMTSVGHGERNALIVAGVHPNEPVGFLTAFELIHTLLSDQRVREAHGFTWHFVQNMDPDGVRLNEGWFKSPGDRAKYAREFFRPAPENQPEWTFPTHYKTAHFTSTLPEAIAVSRAIEELRPELYVTLHNSETGGAYWFLKENDAELIDAFHAIAAHLDVPVDEGEGESPELRQFAAGVYGASTFADDYEAAITRGEDPAAGFCGSSSNEYAAACGALTMIPEVPYWRPVDATVFSTDELFSGMLLRTSAMMADVAAELAYVLDLVEGEKPLDSPLLQAARAFIPMLTEDADADRRRAEASEKDATRYATSAETAGRETRVRSFALRYGGSLRRALDVQERAGIASPTIRQVRARLDQFFEYWLERGDPAPTETIPVAALVGVQLGSVLAFADSVASRTAGPT